MSRASVGKLRREIVEPEPLPTREPRVSHGVPDSSSRQALLQLPIVPGGHQPTRASPPGRSSASTNA